jgi:putative hydrolase of the HAD superfamily
MAIILLHYDDLTGEMMFEMIALDADDTLWDNEIYYTQAKDEFVQKLKTYQGDEKAVKERLDEIEEGNVAIYGYGIKSFTLSMIEAAIEISRGGISGKELEAITGLGRKMLSTRVRVFPWTEETLALLAKDWQLMMITKGDVFEQSKKIERTGLLKYFRHVEIVGDKTTAIYRNLLERHRIQSQRFLMVGNSLRSDILPVLELGSKAVYIPYESTWAHEHRVDKELPKDGYYELESLAQLPDLVRRLSRSDRS